LQDNYLELSLVYYSTWQWQWVQFTLFSTFTNFARIYIRYYELFHVTKNTIDRFPHGWCAINFVSTEIVRLVDYPSQIADLYGLWTKYLFPDKEYVCTVAINVR
jgi:hypothetical protein